MSVSAAPVTVGTSATLLGPTAAGPGGASVCVKNTSGSTIYLGGSGVTTATGLPLAAGEVASLDLARTELLYGVAAGSTIVNVIACDA